MAAAIESSPYGRRPQTRSILGKRMGVSKDVSKEVTIEHDPNEPRVISGISLQNNANAAETLPSRNSQRQNKKDSLQKGIKNKQNRSVITKGTTAWKNESQIKSMNRSLLG